MIRRNFGSSSEEQKENSLNALKTPLNTKPTIPSPVGPKYYEDPNTMELPGYKAGMKIHIFVL